MTEGREDETALYEGQEAEIGEPAREKGGGNDGGTRRKNKAAGMR